MLLQERLKEAQEKVAHLNTMIAGPPSFEVKRSASPCLFLFRMRCHNSEHVLTWTCGVLPSAFVMPCRLHRLSSNAQICCQMDRLCFAWVMMEEPTAHACLVIALAV